MQELVIFSEEEFREKMDTLVADFRRDHVVDGYFESFDGTRIHYSYCHKEGARGTLVMSHGFCEFFGKYHEVSYYFYEMGYSFYFIDHRGHGYSDRKVKEMDKVFVKSYDEYVEDLKCYMDQVVLPEMDKAGESKDKLFLFAHSMGGAIASLFLEKYPAYFKAAVLSSPMMGMNLGKYPLWVAKTLMFVSKILGWDLNYVPGQKGFDRKPVFATSSTLSEARYNYAFDMRLSDEHFSSYGGCYAWTRASIKATDKLLKNAGKIHIPVLLLQAGRDTMVKAEGHAVFKEKAENVTFVQFPESKHEIFNATNETLPRYYKEVFGFLASFE